MVFLKEGLLSKKSNIGRGGAPCPLRSFWNGPRFPHRGKNQAVRINKK